jgi:hypothetical protein
MSSMVSRFTLVLTAALAMTAVAAAQTSFTSSAGMPTAEARAKDSLGADVVPVSIATTGSDPSGATGFDIETGTSSFWTYTHYSPSRDEGVIHVLFQAQPGIFVGSGALLPKESGLSEAHAITLDGAFANSDQMAAAIRADGQYQAFRATFGAIRVDLAMLTSVLSPDLPELPQGFPSDSPIWSVVMSDDSDSATTLTCLVAASTGQTVCVSSRPTGVAAEPTRQALAVRVAPNPASGIVSVKLAPSVGRLEGLRLGLFDASGAQVLDLGPSLAGNDYSHAEFDAASIPAGIYFVRAVGAGMNSVVATVALGR